MNIERYTGLTSNMNSIQYVIIYKASILVCLVKNTK